MSYTIPLVLIGLLVAGCNSSEFDGAGKKASSGSKESSKNDDADDQDDSSKSDIETDENGTSTQKDGEIAVDDDTSTDDALEEDDEVGDESKCWFAVSGGYFGWDANMRDRYQGKFPGGTTSGNPIKHGEGFDTVGGIYLRASKTPYEYGKGNRELDKAVDMSFDAIAVAPGMTVEIRDANGTVIHKGEGPFIATSNEYGGNAGLGALMRAKPGVQTWILDYLTTKNNAVPQLALHPGRWVKVTHIAGKPCE